MTAQRRPGVPRTIRADDHAPERRGEGSGSDTAPDLATALDDLRVAIRFARESDPRRYVGDRGDFYWDNSRLHDALVAADAALAELASTT